MGTFQRLSVILLAVLLSHAGVSFAGPADLQPSDIALMKSRLDCKNPMQVYYCDALDQFSSGQTPQASSLTFFAGSSLFVNRYGKNSEIKEEASYLILDSKRVMYDSIISDNEEEKKQAERYLSYFHRGELPPSSDPVVAFSKNLSAAKASAFQVVGRSRYYERPLKSYDVPNAVYIRETPDLVISVEVAGPIAQAKSLFFVGVFSKKLKTAGK